MITLADILAASERIASHIHKTPVFTSDSINNLLSKRVYFKAEHLQKTGSFKVRGALNAALQAGDVSGFIAVSSGNHAQAVAYAAGILGKPALIVMPDDSSPLKIVATKAYGAKVFTNGVTVENRMEALQAKVKETGYHIIHPFNDERVMAGQGTQALELLEQAPDIEAVLVAVGGGGLISGIAIAMQESNPEVKVIGVEPETANDAQQSLEAKCIVPLPRAPSTVADAVRTIALGNKTFPYIQKYVDEIVTASDQKTMEAQRLIMERLKQVVEPTAALALAPLLDKNNLPNNTAVILCGGNWLPK